MSKRVIGFIIGFFAVHAIMFIVIPVVLWMLQANYVPVIGPIEVLIANVVAILGGAVGAWWFGRSQSTKK